MQKIGRTKQMSKAIDTRRSRERITALTAHYPGSPINGLDQLLQQLLLSAIGSPGPKGS